MMSADVERLLGRFKPEDALVEAVKRQKIIGGDDAAARAIVATGDLVGFGPGETLIGQGEFDQSALMLLAGKVSLTINGCRLPYGRGPGEILGELSAINPELPRTATVEATEPVAALRIESDALIEAGRANPEIWRLLAVELTRKLEQRNQFIDTSNKIPRVFIISSSEALEVAEEIRLGLVKSKVADVLVWSDDQIFAPGNYPIEDLRREVTLADFGIAIAHPDDIRRSRGKQSAVPRDNVIYELGFFTSVLGRDRTLLLVPGDEDVELPSDFKGLTPLKYAKPNDRVPIATVIAPTVRQIVKVIDRLKVRSKLEPAR